MIARKIKIDYLIYILLLLPFLEMPRLGYIPYINVFFFVFKAISAACVFILTLLRRKLSELDYIFFLYCFVVILSTLLNNGNITSSVSESLAILVPILLFELYMKKLSIKQLLMPIVIIYTIYALITLFQIIQIPFEILVTHGERDSYKNLFYDEYGPIFALGDTKRFLFILLPLNIFNMVSNVKRNIKDRIKVISIYIVSVFIIIYSWEVTAILTMVLLAVFYFLYDNRIISRLIKKINCSLVFVGYLLTNVLLVLTPFLSYLSVFFGLFGKSVTLSGRVYVWEKCLYLVSQSPILGYGINREYTAQEFWGLVHMHNLLLNCTYVGGVALLFIFIYFLYRLSARLSKKRITRLASVFIVGMIAFCVTSLVDTTDYNVLYLMLSVAWYANDLILNIDKPTQTCKGKGNYENSLCNC